MNIAIRRKLTNGGVWTLIGRGIAIIAAVAINALLARVLSPQNLGTYFLVFSIALFLSNFSNLGLSRSIVRIIPGLMAEGKTQAARQVILFSLIVVSISAFIFALMIGLGGGSWAAENIFHSKSIAAVSFYLAVLVFLLSLRNLLAEILRALYNIFVSRFIDDFGHDLILLPIIGAFWFLGWKNNLVTIIRFALIVNFFIIFIGLTVVLKNVKRLTNDGSHYKNMDTLKISSAFWMITVIFFLQNQLPVWIIGFFLEKSDIAIFTAVIQLVSVVYAPSLVMLVVIPPIIAELYSLGRINELENILRKSATILIVPSGLLFSLLILFGNDILSFIYGDFYRTGYYSVIALALGMFVNVITGYCGEALVQTGHQAIHLTIMGITTFCAMIGAVWLSQIFGILGVAISMALGNVFQNLFALFFAKKKIGIWTHVSLDFRFF